MGFPKNKTIPGLILIFLCIAGGIWGIVNQKKLKNSHKICIAVIHHYIAGGRGNAGGIWIDYDLEVKGKSFKGSTLFNMSDISPSFVEMFMLRKSFPAIYNPSDPLISSLMIMPADFKKYGYDFPDSLNWVLPYLKNTK